MKNFRERILKVIKGDGGQRSIVWVPRFDLWFNAHSFLGTLPDRYAHCTSAIEVSREMGVGYHGIVADYLRPDDPEGLLNRGLGIFTLREYPYSVKLHGVERDVEHEGEITRVTYRTPKGKVKCEFSLTEEMKRAGVSISWINRHIIEDEDDFEAAGYIFENAEVEPAYEEFLRFKDEVSDSGLAAACGCPAGSPMQYILRDLMNPTKFLYAIYDYPKELKKLSDQIAVFYEQLMPVVADCPAEVILFGANFDETITYPPFYEEHILPWMQTFTSMVHDRGKYVISHTDGENKTLWSLYCQSGFDIAEAVAIAPMTKNTIKEVFDAVSGTMTIFGGVSSIFLLSESFSENAFEDAVREVLNAVRPDDRLILGISDTTPVNSDFSRVERIKDIVDELTGV